MEQTEFLEENIFKNLKKLKPLPDQEELIHFSEADFEVLLQRAEHFGLGIYTIESWKKDAQFSIAKHDGANKKATDPRWYKRSFLTSKKGQSGLSYSATYKVSNKLLARE